MARVIPQSIDKPIIKVLTGVRRSGKSTLLKLTIKHLITQGVDKKKYILPVITLMNVIMLAFTWFAAKSMGVEPRALMPALRSNWLTIHVSFMFISYAAFTISFLTAIMQLVFKDKKDIDFNIISYKNILFGFPFLTLGILTGAVWADYAWGSYWQWDPKEVWSLITWLYYAVYLHLRFTKNWSPSKSSKMAIFGFFVVLFTYFGVNYLLSGLHSYAK